MRTQRLGTNGPMLTVIGFGAWAIGGPWRYGWGSVDDEESIRTIHRALDDGINWIDTAAVYGFGHSEEIVERAVRGMSAKPFIATKCGLVREGNNDARRCSSPASIRQEAEASLRRLKVNCIDLYQIHWHDADVPIEDSWGAMVQLQKEGKARFIGVSNYDLAILEQCHAIAPVQSLQPPYSLLNRAVEPKILPFCRANGIGVVAYSPMQSGLLTGRFDRGKLAADDWRFDSPYYQDPYLSNVMTLVERMRPIAAGKNLTVGQLAVSWVLANPAITVAIVGARTESQSAENALGGREVLSPEEVQMLQALAIECVGE